MVRLLRIDPMVSGLSFVERGRSWTLLDKQNASSGQMSTFDIYVESSFSKKPFVNQVFSFSLRFQH